MFGAGGGADCLLADKRGGSYQRQKIIISRLNEDEHYFIFIFVRFHNFCQQMLKPLTV